jgi:hypothetical protein
MSSLDSARNDIFELILNDHYIKVVSNDKNSSDTIKKRGTLSNNSRVPQFSIVYERKLTNNKRN